MKKKFLIVIIFICINFSAFSLDIRKELLLSSYIKGINLANGVGILKISKNKNSFFLNANTVGVFALLYSWKQETYVLSKMYDNQLISKEYKSQDKRKDKKGHMHLIFSKGIPKIISAQPNPKDNPKRNISNQKNLENTSDPITAILNIGFKNQCKKVSKVFDGKRRYNIYAKHDGESIIKKNEFFNKDIKVIKCLFDIEKLEGYTEKEVKKYPKKGIIWFKKYDDVNLYLPAKIEIKTSWGSFICLIKERKK